MIDILLQPFTYNYMLKAILVCMMVSSVCAFLSCYLMLKGWSLMGDALAHSVVPGVALSYVLALPYAMGAFFSGLLAALSMTVLKQKTKLREDAVIGLVFTSFFAFGLLMISIYPTSINVQSVILGDVLSISDYDIIQVLIICVVCLVVLCLKWRDLVLIFFDESYAYSIALKTHLLKLIFFTLLSAACVAALQTVGACLVIAMVITPGATAYLLTDRFGVLIILAISFGLITSGFGAYLSFFLDLNPGGLIVAFQTLLFLLVFLFAPKYGFLKRRQVLDA
ncbi:MAG: metal ABC transporter permease [Pseudomonadota bacterium]